MLRSEVSYPALFPMQAAILAKKLEQVALQQAMDEKLAEIQQQESEITRLKGRVASLVGKANGAEVSRSHSIGYVGCFPSAQKLGRTCPLLLQEIRNGR